MPVLAAAEVDEELAQLAGLAVLVMNDHANVNGLCAICGCAWPCLFAVLAEHNLEHCARVVLIF